AVEDDGIIQGGGRDMCLGRLANNASLSHEQNSVDCKRQPMAAYDGKPCRGAHGTRLAEFQLDGRTRPDHITRAPDSLVADRPAVDERSLMGLEQIALAIAEERGVASRNIAHKGNICVAVGSGSAENNAVVHADEVAAYSVDP